MFFRARRFYYEKFAKTASDIFLVHSLLFIHSVAVYITWQMTTCIEQ